MSTLVEQKWTKKTPFPKDNFILRCTDEAFGQSSSGNPMITLDFEIISPETVDVGTALVNVSGVQIRKWYVTKNFDGDTINIDKSAKSAEALKALYKAFGLDAENINPDNPVLGFKGKCVHALLYGKQEEQTKSPTSAQLAEGKRKGDVIIDPVTKLPMVQYSPQIDTIYGLAQVDASNRPY